MADLIVPLPRYRCHKEVSALRIKHVIETPSGFELHFEGDRFVPAFVSRNWVVSKEKPENLVGGYYVVYDDGYQSWSPAAAFGAGYTLLS